MNNGNAYFARRCGSTGHEIVGPDGIIGWTIDAVWATRIVELLNGANDQDSFLAVFPDTEMPVEA